MTQEEKLKEAKKLYESANADQRYVLESLFPELKESEDERMMNQLHSWMKEFGGAEEYTEKVYQWIKGLLEKQGEENTIVVIPKFRVGDVIRPKGSTAEYTIESISGECYHGKGWGLHISCDNDYELVEQKPAWSEEDNNKINTIKYVLHELDNHNFDNWLKSLKDRYTWKPSVEQLEALAEALSLAKNCGEENAFDLRTLLEQLKAL